MIENKPVKKINKRLIIVLILLIISVISGTFAWFTFSSKKSALVLTVGDINKTKVTLNPYQITGSLIPTNNYNDEGNVYTQIEVFNDNDEKVQMELYYKINQVSDELKNNGLYYTIVKSSNDINGPYDKIIENGNFQDTTDKKVVISENIEPRATAYYRAYLWVINDGEQSSIQNESLDVELNGNLKIIPSPSKPVLDPGMIPVKIANNGTVKTVLEHDTSWYNYDNKEWANVVLVDSDSRSTYQGTTGKTVNQDDILAYYVWIPRYSYRIPKKTSTCKDIVNPSPEDHPECYKYSMSENDKNSFIAFVQYVVVNEYGESNFTLSQAEELVNLALETGKFEGTTLSFLDGITMYNDNMDPDIEYEITFMPNKIMKSIVGRTIDISFESKDAPLLTGDAINTFRTHPAFTFGTENLSGIWVGKFETTGNSTTPTVLPNLYSIYVEGTSDNFQTSLKFAGGTLSNGIVSFAGSDTYGLTQNTDSHMMKNSEWGAVAYLSYSIYGINSHIRGKSKDLTGCGSLEENFTEITSECQMAYGSVTSYPQSTTGNISGVFDMSGGMFKSVMGVLADENGNPRSGKSDYDNTGFNGMLEDGTLYSDGIDFPPSKYYDLYTEGNALTLCNGEICYGHALFETYDDYTSFSLYSPKEDFLLNGSSPWIVRSGTLSMLPDYELINTAFNFILSSGDYDMSFTFYTVLVVD